MLTPIAKFLGRYKTALLRRLLPNYRRQRGNQQEIRHWSLVLRSKQHVEQDPDFSRRLDPDRPLQPELSALLSPSESAAAVLDVGSGPLSTVGITWKGGRISLTGADPLGESYLQQLAAIGLAPNCRLVACDGIELESVFGRDAFDLVTATNSLDHCHNPVMVVSEMIKVCKPGGHLYLHHAQNEGLHERYRGMHQWNFRMERGQPVANDGRSSYYLLNASERMKLVSHRLITGSSRPILEWIFRKV